MQPETAQQRRPEPWPFGPVRGSDGPGPLPVVESAVPVVELAVPAMTSPAPHPDTPWATSPAAPKAGGDDARTETDDLVARLRARRSTSGVAAAYAAAHGHPADPRAEQGARRWALTGTTAVVAVVTVLLLGLGVAALSLRGGDVVALAPVAADGGPDGGSARPGAGGDEVVSGPDPSSEPVGSGGPGGSGGSGEPGGSGAATGTPGAAGGGLLVHVVGEVARPGLVTLPDGARVADAVEAAGGVTRKADLAAVNLARAVVDGEQLYVPRPGEPVPGTAAAGADGPAAPGGGGGAGSAGGAVDINTADAAGLEALPGVGPSIAQAIVEWRETNGAFASVDELDDVPGIGPATLDELRDSARVGP
ncbi:helix-hairpin-helix domain-containing protein [Promicromonospora sp. NPDC050262]|uniref:helix-hairpin-helix domain-containing protein n=1 Tax=Promicromonospora sp. NPDC050262 TaxID=3155036 RepID=UPI0033CC7486